MFDFVVSASHFLQVALRMFGLSQVTFPSIGARMLDLLQVQLPSQVALGMLDLSG